jgi:DDE superfamily endonuclease
MTSLAHEAIEARGAMLLYLPPYSPDLNPIEQFFSKLKAILRKAAVRSIDNLWAVIGSRPKGFSPSECAAYLLNAGYGQPIVKCSSAPHLTYPRRASLASKLRAFIEVAWAVLAHN